METRAAKRRKIELEEAGKTSILHLNDDCLLHILSYVKVWDLLATELVCKRFNILTRETYKSFKVLNLSKRAYRDAFRFPSEVVEKIFRRVGPRVHTLKLSSYSVHTQGEKPPRYIWMYCKKLHTVYLKNFYIDNAICQKLSPAFRNVKSVHLSTCDLDDSTLWTMFDFREIRVLNLLCCGNFLDAPFFTLLKNIQKICLAECLLAKSFYHDVFDKFCENNKQLRSLNIQSCGWIDEYCLESIEKHLKNLECLKLNSDYEDVPYESYLPIMDLPKITHFALRKSDNAMENKVLLKIAAHNRLEYLDLFKYNIQEISEVFSILTKLKKLKMVIAGVTDATLELLSCTETLEELDISYNDITSLGLEKLIQRCKNIRFINVSVCKNVSGDFIPKILNHLKERPQQLVINVALTKICNNLEYEVIFDSKLLKIINGDILNNNGYFIEI